MLFLDESIIFTRMEKENITEKSNSYFVYTTDSLYSKVEAYYDSCYTDKGEPKNADHADGEMIQSVLKLLSEVQEILESFNYNEDEGKRK